MKLLLADENFPFPSVKALRHYGHDVKTLLEMDLAEQAISDEEIVKIASEQKRAVLTLNRKDFKRLHNNLSSHSGIIICTFDANFGALAQRIHESINVCASLEGQLIRISRG